MGPKVKKSPKNAFSFFLDDYVQKERRRGRDVSHRIAAEECAPLWKELPPEEKEKYQKVAAEYKTTVKNNLENKFTSAGISYAEIERQEKEKREKIKRTDNEIKFTISNLDSSLVKTHLFYIIHCNYYCKTREGLYIPGELAIVEYNLRDGIRRTFHVLINPGPIPLGFALDAKTAIEEVHGLPFPPYEEGDSDYFGILKKILDFLKPGVLPDGRYPPLYCTENNLKISENILQSLSDTKADGKNFFRVFPLYKMFFWLKNKCVENLNDETVGFPVAANAQSEINKDMYCYTPNISCSFHINTDEKYHNCSLSIVQRLVFIICDHCCQHLNIPLVPGKHCRFNADTERTSCAKKPQKPRRQAREPEAFDNDFDGVSSFGGDLGSCRGEEEEGAACSFLHEELNSKFDRMDMSSVCSRGTRNGSIVSSVWSGRVGRRETSEEEEEEWEKVVSLGRGSARR